MIPLLLVHICAHLTLADRLLLIRALNFSPMFLVKYHLWEGDICLVPWVAHRSYGEAKSAYHRFHTGRPGRIKSDAEGNIWQHRKIIYAGHNCKEIISYRQARAEWRILYLTFEDTMRSVNWSHTQIENVDAVMVMSRGIVIRTKDNHFYYTDGRFRNFNSPFGTILYLGQIKEKGKVSYHIHHHDKERFISARVGENKYVAHFHSRDGCIHRLTDACVNLNCW